MRLSDFFKKGFWSDKILYLEYIKSGQDEDGFYNKYRVKNRWKYVGDLFIGNSYMQFQRSNTTMIWTGNFTKLR